MTKSGYAFLLIYDTAYVERTRKVGKASMSKKSWWNIIKGAIVGGTMLVPGDKRRYDGYSFKYL